MAWTTPYMHNDVFGTLEVVVDFHDADGGDDPNRDSRLQPPGLVPPEKANLIACLQNLSGDSFDIDAYVWREDVDDYALIEDWLNTKN